MKKLLLVFLLYMVIHAVVFAGSDVQKYIVSTEEGDSAVIYVVIETAYVHTDRDTAYLKNYARMLRDWYEEELQKHIQAINRDVARWESLKKPTFGDRIGQGLWNSFYQSQGTFHDIFQKDREKEEQFQREQIQWELENIKRMLEDQEMEKIREDLFRD